MAKADDYLVVGRISGLYGVRGWVKVFSETEPRDNILGYSPWYLERGGQWRSAEAEAGRLHGKAVVAKLAGYDDRDQAAELIGTPIAVTRDQLPKLDEGEYYWTDLVGLEVVTVEGLELGTVDHLFETGSNDVLVVRGDRERLIPFTLGAVVTAVNLEAGRITVDWDPDF